MAYEKKDGRIRKGIGTGITAGIIFGIVEMAASAAAGSSPILPARMAASVVLGSSALETVSSGTALVVGTIVHLVLSAAFGAVYALIVSRMSRETRVSTGREAVGGVVYGTLLWLVNFQVIAALLYPWFLEPPQFPQMAMHALFYGLPLGILQARMEQRTLEVVEEPVQRRAA